MDAAHQSEVGEIRDLQNQGAPSLVPTIVEAYPDSKELQSVAPEQEFTPKNISEGDRSLLNMLSNAPKLREKILLLQKNNPELMILDEPTFKRDYRMNITLVTQRIRVSLWLEFEAAVQSNRPMRVKQIYGGTCGETTFYSLIENPVRLAYILCPPADYVVMLKEAHGAGLEKLREIFSAQIIDEEGFLNPKAAEVVLKAFALLDARLKGAVIQRIDQRTLNANVQVNNNSMGGAGLPADMDALEQELIKARKQIAQYTKIPRHPTPMELAEETKDIIIDVHDSNQNQAIGGNAKVLK